jgi:hypothetical protein
LPEIQVKSLQYNTSLGKEVMQTNEHNIQANGVKSSNRITYRKRRKGNETKNKSSSSSKG